MQHRRAHRQLLTLGRLYSRTSQIVMEFQGGAVGNFVAAGAINIRCFLRPLASESTATPGPWLFPAPPG
jgi:hypothetical protein